MSSVPAEIAGLGPSTMKLRVSPGFDPLKAQVGPDEYFLLSRIDGAQTIRDILLATGLPIERGIAIVKRLRSIGALLLPGETSAPAPAAPPPKPPRPASTTPISPMTPPHGIPSVVDVGRAPTIQVTPADGVPTLPSSFTQSRTPTPQALVPPRTQTPPSTPPTGVPRTQTPPTGVPRTGPPSRITPRNHPVVADPTQVARTATPLGMPPARPPARVSSSEIEPPTNRSWPAGTGRPPAVDHATLDGPTTRKAPPDIHIVLPNPTETERAALAEPGDLGLEDRLRLLAMSRLVVQRDPWALLGVHVGADAKDLKRAYFKLSKDVHPDRFYGKQLGTFADRLSEVFEAVSRAYAKLTAPDKAKATGVHHAVPSEQPQTPQEYAAELFDRACGLEVGGDALGAMKLFAAAVRINPQTRYLRRAATCALAAEQPKTALEYAKKAQAMAPSDPSAARLLASAFRATGRLADAEEVLVMAMALKSENDVLGQELRNDLAEVRRLMSG